MAEAGIEAAPLELGADGIALWTRAIAAPRADELALLAPDESARAASYRLQAPRDALRRRARAAAPGAVRYRARGGERLALCDRRSRPAAHRRAADRAAAVFQSVARGRTRGLRRRAHAADRRRHRAVVARGEARCDPPPAGTGRDCRGRGCTGSGSRRVAAPAVDAEGGLRQGAGRRDHGRVARNGVRPRRRAPRGAACRRRSSRRRR